MKSQSEFWSVEGCFPSGAGARIFLKKHYFKPITTDA